MVGLFLRNRRGALEEHALPLCVSVVKKWDEVELVPPNKKGARRRLVIFFTFLTETGRSPRTISRDNK